MDKVHFKKPFLATGVGSVPHLDAKVVCDFIEDNFQNQIIFWPQLVKRSFSENMYVQFSEGIPGVTVDSQAKKIHIDTQAKRFLKEMEESYLHAMNNDDEYFAISREYAVGFYEMLSRRRMLNGLEYFKGQVIGPVSFGLTVTDQNNQAVIYNPDLSEILVKVLAMKAKWQIKKIKSVNPKLKIIIFIDEPYLVSVGTSFISVKKEKIIGDINELINAIHSEGALAGVHCCGNTDWSMVLETGLDILSFDAYNYLDNLLLYPAALDKFFNDKGRLAWGIIPNDKEFLDNLSVDNLIERITKAGKENDILKNNGLITPSCGCGTLSESLAEKVHQLAIQVASKLS
ncbi:MAG: hypothetical protein Q8N14_05015 [Candidatus Omnitrophota bacterium]|nr:hypothetical protein [Candidatus Omnitrophota bacterium]